MLKFNTSCAVLAYLSSNLLNEVGLSLFRYFEVDLRVCYIVVKKFIFAISSPDEFLLRLMSRPNGQRLSEMADDLEVMLCCPTDLQSLELLELGRGCKTGI